MTLVGLLGLGLLAGGVMIYRKTTSDKKVLKVPDGNEKA